MQTILEESKSTEKLMKNWKRKIQEAQDENKYLEPYPPEMRREFWKHKLNPITGTPTPSVVRAKETESND